MLTPERRWWYEQRANRAVKALRKNGFEALSLEDGANVLNHVLTIVPAGAVVSFGDSLTLRQIGLYQALDNHGCELINPPEVQDELSAEDKRRLRLGCFTSDVFFCSANAITLDGKVVNVDGIGNRVAPTLFGPPRVIIIAGANKLVDDVEGALARIKGESAPMHAWRDGYTTPCGRSGVCSDCRGASRMCRATVILEGPTKQTETTIIIVGKELGL